MKKNINQYIDLEKVDALLEGFSKSTGFVTAILDLEGNVLSQSGWRQICTEFHRVHPETSKRCVISDTDLANKVKIDQNFHAYTCLNGLTDVAVPLKIGGQHVANLFSGQFFFEEPDIEFFRKQAKEFDFDEEEYINAVKKVPVVSEEKVKNVMDFLLQMTDLISDLGFKNAEYAKLNKSLSDSQEELKAINQVLELNNQQLLASEQELRKEKIFSERIVETSNAIIVGLDIDHIIRIFNRGAEQITGYKKEEVIGKDWFKVFFSEDILDEMNKVWKEAWGVQSHSYLNPIIVKSGEEKVVSWQTTGMYDGDDVSNHLQISIGEDITERIKSEVELQKSEAKFKSYIENAPDGVFIANENGEYVEVNKAACSITGYSQEELLSLSIPDIIQEEYIEKAMANFQTLGIVGNVIDEFGFITKSGEKRFWRVDAVKLSETRFLGFVKDITERKLADQAIIELKEFNESIVRNLTEGIILENTDGIIQFANPAMSRMLGYEDGELVGKHWTCFVPDSQVEIVNDANMRRKSGESDQYEMELIKKNGDSIFVLVGGVPNLVKGTYVGLLAAFTDITERKLSEEKLKESEERFRSFVDTVNSGVAIYNVINEGNYGSDYIIQDFNQFALNHEKKKKDEVIGKSLKDIRPNIDEYGLIEIFRKVWKTGESAYFPAKIYVDDEYSNYYENRVFRLPSGEIVSVYDDVTKREIAELALIESQERFELAMNASNDGLFDWNLKTNEIYYSPGWKKMIGYEDHELPNDFSVWEKTTAPEDVQKSWELQQKLITKQIDRFVIEFKMKHKDGNWIDVLARAKAIFNDNGNAIRIVGTHTDITERRKAERQIALSESRYRKAQEIGNVGNWEYNIQTSYFWGSDEAKRIYGFDVSSKDFTVEEVESCIPDRNNVHQTLIDLIEKEKPYDIEFEIITKDKGESRFIHSQAILEKDEKGNAVKVSGVIHDITERKKAADQLKESEARFKHLVETASDAIYLINQDGFIVDVNNTATKMLQIDRSDLIGKPIDTIDPTYPLKDFLVFWQSVPFDQQKIFETEHLTKNGKFVPVEVSGKKFKINNSVYYFGVARDITERKKAEEDTNALTKRLQLSTESAMLGIWELDIKNNKLSWDKRMFELYGIAPENFGGAYEAWKKGVHPDDLIEVDSLVQSAIDGKIDFHSQFRVVLPNGEIRVLEAHAIVTRESDGTPISMIGVNKDITDLKETELALIKAKEKAEESNRLKTAFLNNMSHEIRTPLNGITGFIELLQNPQIDDEKKQEYFDIINKSSDRLIATVTDIIDISRIEAGLIKVFKADVSVNDILTEQYNFFHHQAKLKGLELVYIPSLSEKESQIVTDKRKLEGILTNLIKNAIKFSEHGEISFSCSLIKEKGDDFLEFFVKDSGKGIPADRIDAIFNRFEQADIEDKNAHQGSGLGLAITKSYVEMLGGNIRVISKEGYGSIFTFTIPYIKPRAEESSVEQNMEECLGGTLTSLSVIVAEDDQASRMYFEAIFANMFKKLTFTSSGIETIAKFQENPNTDLILMDVKMPDMNGYDATREIRKLDPNVIIIAQTAFGLSGDREKAIEVGCNDYISKPIKKEKLLKIIYNHFRK